jgi:hypothetical protein
MHEDEIVINFSEYNKVFSKWKKQNKNKLSTEFDKEIGIGKWKTINNKTVVTIKDHKKFFLAQLKYGL